MASYLQEFNRTISSDVHSDDRILALVCDNFPAVIDKLNSNEYSLSDLIEISEFIALQREIVRNNLQIAFRLIGGVSKFCNKIDIDPESVHKFFKTHQLDELVVLFVNHFDFEASWFEHGRCYYPDEHIMKFRMKNVFVLLSYVENTPDFCAFIAEQLSPRQSDLELVFTGTKSPRSSNVCRLIEASSSLVCGALDMHPNKFVVHCAEHFGVKQH
ncbi:hypothetical protein [Vibrio harveyi]|uniref:hypothetical protein n=1 Tax=Vibrio harveyi TaxID=669 RepID=UPI002480E130|nr:hypothetical protein [Vibrio harveyi]